jgi:hypothetical protein
MSECQSFQVELRIYVCVCVCVCTQAHFRLQNSLTWLIYRH